MPDPELGFDVAIAGAGLAGSSLALRLSRRGARVALLDPSTFPRDKVCGEFLSPEAWGVLGRMGLEADVEGSGYHPIRLVRITTPAGREVIADVVGGDGRPGIGLSRSALDDLLVRRAREAGAEVFEGARVGGPVLEDGRVVGVHARDARRGPFEVRARVTIAADGRHSALVRQTGRTRGRSWARPRLLGLKRHLEVADPAAAEEPETVGLHLIPGGYGGTCRIEGSGLTNLCALVPEGLARDRRGDLDRVAAECLGRNPALARLWAAARPAGEWKTVAGVRVQVSTPIIPGILYAGDCQGTVDPLGGQGMTMALLGAEMLEPIAAGAIRSDRGADFALQRACLAEWHRRFDRRIGLCRGFHHFLINPALVDVASRLGPAAARFLAACYHQTRDRSSRALIPT